MRRIRAIAVTVALVSALLCTQVTTANAAVTGGKAKGSADNSYGELAFHASGFLTKSSGGFELYHTAVGYFSGKVQCYVQNGTSTGAFVALITKADDPTQVGKYVYVWLGDSPDQFSFTIKDSFTCDTGIIQPQTPLTPIASGGYIDLRP